MSTEPHERQDDLNPRPQDTLSQPPTSRGKADEASTRSPQHPVTDQPARRSSLPSIEGYRVFRELGQGGMGVVYQAHHIKLNRMVALKMLLTGPSPSPEARARFLQEAQSVAALQHPHIVQVYELGEFEGQPYFAMELMEGGHLGNQIASRTFNNREAAQTVETLARAIHYAHQCGIIHRDLKPGNILLSRDGFIKVTDFGLAKLAQSESPMTKTGAILGTPGYLSPEQAAGRVREIDARSDVFSLGVILYELLTGKRPFDGFTEFQIVSKVVDSDPISPAWHRSTISRDLETICLKCLQKSPAARYATAEELANDLRRFLDGLPILARRRNLLQRASYKVRRHPIRALLSALLCTVAAATAWSIWYADAYLWERTTYFEDMITRFGVPEGVHPISLETVAQRGASFELTRQGRRGKLMRMRVVNGYRAEPEESQMRTWLDGLFNEHSLSASTRFHYEYSSDGRILVESMFDHLGVPTLEGNFRYLTGTAGQPPEWDTIQRMSGHNNQELRLPTLVTLAKIRWSPAGFEERVMFANSYEQPRRNGDGVFGYQFSHFADGRIERVTNLDDQGKKMLNRLGFAEAVYELDAQGRRHRLSFLGLQGEKVTCAKGYHAIEYQYDPYGNITRAAYLDEAGQLTPDYSTGQAISAISFERGCAVKIELLDANGNLVEYYDMATNIAEFDALGRPLRTFAYRADGTLAWLDVRRYHDGLLVEESTWNDAEQTQLYFRKEYDYDERQLLHVERLISPDNLLLAQIERQYDQFRRNTLVQHWMFVGESRRPWFPSHPGCAQVETRYHENGFPREVIYSLYPEHIPWAKHVERFDDEGHLIEVQWLDDQGQLVHGSQGYARSTIAYDLWGRPTAVRHLNAQGEIVSTRVVVAQAPPAMVALDLQLQEGDIIRAYEELPIENAYQLRSLLQAPPFQRTAAFTVQRGEGTSTWRIPRSQLHLLEFVDRADDLNPISRQAEDD